MKGLKELNSKTIVSVASTALMAYTAYGQIAAGTKLAEEPVLMATTAASVFKLLDKYVLGDITKMDDNKLYTPIVSGAFLYSCYVLRQKGNIGINTYIWYGAILLFAISMYNLMTEYRDEKALTEKVKVDDIISTPATL